ncbi:MAG: AhpC/TSA family protein [Muribaculaceae bacterium]|nr:AhpC/TSA family protein [Muribaculaceae bacterium]
MKQIFTAAAAALCALCISCSSDSDKWGVKGTISGLSETDAIILEGNNQGYWYFIDSIKADKDGRFAYSHAPLGYPDIYRLRVADKSIYFPIDSIETVTVNASMPDITTSYTLSGTPQAENLARVDSMIAASAAQLGSQSVATDMTLKRQLGQMLLADPAGIVTYYIISKSIDGRPLFNPADRMDNRYIGAVANAFNERRPNDPRTNYLKNLFISNRKSSSTSEKTLQANLVGAFNIELYDNKGVKHSLLDLSKQGKVALLSFTAYGAEWSPAFNVELNKLYQKYKDSGFEIYQVSLDDNEYAWKEAAKNLPWITVLNDISNRKALNDYNVTVLPTTFVINRNGEIVERVLSVEDLDRAVVAHL